MNKKLFAALLAAVAVAALFALPSNAAENLVNVSWGDSIMVGSGISKLDTPQKVIDSLHIWQDIYEGQGILWRISSEYLKRYYLRQPTDFQKRYDAKVDEVAALFDPVKLVRAETRKNKQLFLLYATFLDHGCPPGALYGDVSNFPWQDKVTIAHPEYQERDLEGNWHYGVLDLSNPDARKFIRERLVDFVNEYDSDGLYLCSRTHSPPALHGDQFGFGPHVVVEYKKRYGIDITKDPRFNYKSPEYAPNCDEVQRWRRLRGEYLVTFIRELRQALGKKRLLYVGLPRGFTMQCPYGNMYVDKETLFKEHLVDGMIIGVLSGRFLYPQRKTPHKDLGFLESGDDRYNLPPLEEEIAKWHPYCDKFGIRLFVGGGFSRTLPAGLDGRMIGAPNARPSVYVPASKALYSRSMTVSGFFRLEKVQDGWAKSPRLVSKYNHDSPAERGWELCVGDKEELVFRTQLVNAQGGTRDAHLRSTATVPREEWFHAAAVIDADKGVKQIYLNGKLVAEEKIPAGYVLNDNADIDIVVGCYAHGSGQNARMMADELWLADRAVPPTAMPAKPLTGKEPGILFYFSFDKGERKADVVAPGVDAKYLGTPKLSPGYFGQALDLTVVD